VRRWNANLARGSPATAQVYLANLAYFLEAHDLTPQGLLDMAPGPRDDLVDDWVQASHEQGLSGGYLKAVKGAVQSWLAHNNRGLQRKIKIPGLNERPTLKDAHIPLQDELRRVLNAATPRQRVALALVAFSGLRPGVLGHGKRHGLDGLRIRDFVEAHLEPIGLVFDQVPTRVLVPSRLSKTRKEYFTFLGPEGCAYVQAHLQERQGDGEKLTPDTPLLTPRNTPDLFLSAGAISALLREPMRACGLKEPPYIWRSYFNNRCLTAERDGLNRDYKVFLMGHGGSLELDYGMRKQMPPDTVAQMRQGYQAALKYLETTTPVKVEDPLVGIVGTLLQAFGLTPTQVLDLDLSRRNADEVVDILRGAVQDQVKAKAPQQRVVNVDLVGSLLAQGWSYAGSLGNGQAVVTAP
jgi:hypothetical protein